MQRQGPKRAVYCVPCFTDYEEEEEEEELSHHNIMVWLGCSVCPLYPVLLPSPNI